jgi:hypothetical protein
MGVSITSPLENGQGTSLVRFVVYRPFGKSAYLFILRDSSLRVEVQGQQDYSALTSTGA